MAIPRNCVFMGEIGLSGEIRMVSQIEYRLKEAEKLGFTKAVIPDGMKNLKTFKTDKYKIEIIFVKHIRDLSIFFNKKYI